MKSNQGFTLIELLVTIAIVGILAAIAYPFLLKHVEDARIAEAQAIAESFRLPTLEHQARTGELPDDVNQNIAPDSLEGLWVYQGDAVFNSPYDYDAHRLDGICTYHITWFGKNRVRDTEPESQIAVGDDFITPIALPFPCDGRDGAIR